MREATPVGSCACVHLEHVWDANTVALSVRRLLKPVTTTLGDRIGCSDEGFVGFLASLLMVDPALRCGVAVCLGSARQWDAWLGGGGGTFRALSRVDLLPKRRSGTLGWRNLSSLTDMLCRSDFRSVCGYICVRSRAHVVLGDVCLECTVFLHVVSNACVAVVLVRLQ